MRAHPVGLKRGIIAVLSLLVLALGPKPATGELIVGVTTQNTLISFDSATPGTVATVGGVTGLLAGDSLVGIDRRPANGVIYGVGVNASTGAGHIYSLNATTGAATLVSTLSADPADATAPFPFTTVVGTSFGVDFNPTVDRLRVTSNTGQNLRINVDNGLVQLDVPLAYQAGDPNFGLAPVVVGIAYSNNFPGASSTVLRGVDIAQSPDLLVIHSNPNGGQLQTSLPLSFDSSLLSYDVSGLTGTPYFATTAAGVGSSSLFAGFTLVGTIGGGVPVLVIAAPVRRRPGGAGAGYGVAVSF
jgi:uncharacterized protein DUF4394